MSAMDIAITAIKRQFNQVIASDPDFYRDAEIVVSNEQQFVREQDRKPNMIYMVVKFLPASVNFGVTVLPITIAAIGEQDKIEICQRLLYEYAQTFNLKEDDGGSFKQVYTTPSVGANFADVWEGYRSLFFMSGTLLISEKANPVTVTYTYEEDGDKKSSQIEAITANAGFDVQLDAQATYSSGDVTESIPMIGTFTVSLVAYLTTDPLPAKIVGIIENRSLNQTFELSIDFKSGASISGTFRLASWSMTQNIGELPTFSATFTY